MIQRGRYSHRLQEQDSDPLSGMANLFDVAMVFAVALMIAIVLHFQITEVFTREDVTLVKNPGQKDMEIIVKKGREITKYKASDGKGSGKGRRIGIAYELENGQVIYVPEGGNSTNSEEQAK
jgi:hypothetical protein